MIITINSINIINNKRNNKTSYAISMSMSDCMKSLTQSMCFCTHTALIIQLLLLLSLSALCILPLVLLFLLLILSQHSLFSPTE